MFFLAIILYKHVIILIHPESSWCLTYTFHVKTWSTNKWMIWINEVTKPFKIKFRKPKVNILSFSPVSLRVYFDYDQITLYALMKIK
jgi:hypothetical protein